MDIKFFGVSGMATITVICFLIGQMVKVTPLANKFIPAIVGIAGAALGITGMLLIPDFPATDYLTAAAIGIASGLAATGVDQAVKQLGGGGNDSK